MTLFRVNLRSPRIACTRSDLDAPLQLLRPKHHAGREKSRCGNVLAALRVLVHRRAACVLIASIVAFLRIDRKIVAQRRCETVALCYAPPWADPPATISKEDNA
jgi:hypothetical protein